MRAACVSGGRRNRPRIRRVTVQDAVIEMRGRHGLNRFVDFPGRLRARFLHARRVRLVLPLDRGLLRGGGGGVPAGSAPRDAGARTDAARQGTARVTRVTNRPPAPRSLRARVVAGRRFEGHGVAWWACLGSRLARSRSSDGRSPRLQGHGPMVSLSGTPGTSLTERTDHGTHEKGDRRIGVSTSGTRGVRCCRSGGRTRAECGSSDLMRIDGPGPDRRGRPRLPGPSATGDYPPNGSKRSVRARVTDHGSGFGQI